MAAGRRSSGKSITRPPRALGEVLDYLGGLGYDHLYLSQPSSRAEQRRGAEPPRPGGGRRASPAAAPSARSRAGESPPAPSRAAPSREVSSREVEARPSSSRDSAPPADAEGRGQTPAEVVSKVVAAPPSGPEERFQFLDEVRRAAEGCVACRLSQGRRKVVFGSGQPGADLMFIGEGPGAEEDRQGLPFVGAAGALLTRIIEAIDLRREEVYIANMVKCRPPRNRDPTGDEVAACRPFLETQIDLVAPKLIVVLGRVAAQALLETSSPLGKLRGQWHRVRGVPTRVTYHPAALLRYEQYKRPTWEDMKAVRDRLRELRA